MRLIASLLMIAAILAAPFPFNLLGVLGVILAVIAATKVETPGG